MIYYYTAITHNDTNEILYAEHFEDEGEMLKRSRQLEAEARRLGPWKCYTGTEPVEAFLARLTAKATDADTVKPDDSDNVRRSKFEAFSDRVDALAAKAGAKTISVLTAPEIDDSAECRPVPPLQLALSAVEVATQRVLDAKTGADALQKRADNLAEEAYGTGAQSEPEERKQVLRRKAVDAQAEADNEKARLYHAEQDLAEKIQAVEGLRNA